MTERGPYLEPLKREDTPELEPTYQDLIAFLGFVPNTELTMARKPRSTKALIDFVKVLYSAPRLPEPLMYLVGLIASASAGCQYCASHNVNRAHDMGIDGAKIAAVWEFSTSSLFEPAEKAALNFAFKAAQSPSSVEASDFEELLKFYSEEEATELLFVVCQFGVFNRFNSAIAATIEPTPLALSQGYLNDHSWDPGKHSP